jgi:Fe-S-cluster-containing hydrogenase component 2
MPAQVDITKCQGCQGCDAICPELAIEWDVINAVPIVDAERCVECGLCVVACDDGAMEILNCKVVDKN